MTSAASWCPSRSPLPCCWQGQQCPNPTRQAARWRGWHVCGLRGGRRAHIQRGSGFAGQTTGRTALPGGRQYWLRLGPTDRMAAFDDYTSTKAKGTGTLTYVIQPGFFGAVRVYGKGDSCTITVKDEPAGAVVKTQTFDLFSQAAGFYELLFTVLPPIEVVGLDDILPLEARRRANRNGQPCWRRRRGGGRHQSGDWRQLIGDSAWGGTEYGASAERKSYTYRAYASDGTYTTIKRGAAGCHLPHRARRRSSLVCRCYTERNH